MTKTWSVLKITCNIHNISVFGSGVKVPQPISKNQLLTMHQINLVTTQQKSTRSKEVDPHIRRRKNYEKS